MKRRWEPIDGILRRTGRIGSNIVATIGRLAWPLLVVVHLTCASAGTADETFDVIVTASSTNAMAGTQPIGEISKGTRLTVTQSNADWYLINMPGANPPQQGWVRKSDVQLVPSGQSVTADEDVRIEAVRRYLQQRLGLRAAGKWHDAGIAAEHALALMRNLAANDPVTLGRALDCAAEDHEWAGEFSAARKLREETLAMQTRSLGKGRWQATDARLALENIGILEKLDDTQRRQLADAAQLNDQAVALQRQGNFVEATKLARQIAKTRGKILGEKHREYAKSLNNLALLCDLTGNYAEAEPLYRKALVITKDVLGEKHPDYAYSLNNLASLFQAMGDYPKAEPLYRQSLVIRKEVFGERNPSYATALGNLAGLYVATGDYAKAEPLLRQASAIDKEVLGEKHPDFATDLNNLAALYDYTHDYVKAIPLFREALAIRKTALGEKHPDYADSLNNMALLYDLVGEFAKAEPLHQQALAISREMQGENSPDYATSLNNLAQMYDGLGEYTVPSRFTDRPCPSARKCLAKSTLTTPSACTTWPCCTRKWGNTPRPCHSPRKRRKSCGGNWNSRPMSNRNANSCEWRKSERVILGAILRSPVRPRPQQSRSMPRCWPGKARYRPASRPCAACGNRCKSSIPRNWNNCSTTW
jgi:tetratricopeptide (TPR) repeat protein